METERNFSNYSVDIVDSNGFQQSCYQYDTQSKEIALKKFDKYVSKEAFNGETVQLWSRIGDDNNIQLVKEKFVKKANDLRLKND